MIMKYIALLILFFSSLTVQAIELECDGMKAELMTENDADNKGGSFGAILYVKDDGKYQPRYISEFDGFPLSSMSYCGGFFSSSPCPSDVYKKGGSRFSSNMVFEFKTNKEDRVILTINESLSDMVAPNSFKAKLTIEENGQYRKTKKINCSVQY